MGEHDGKYVNPGNEGFWEVRSGEYVDKTGLIALVNAVIGKPRSPVCSTSPRRFGKTFAAESLVAYYSCGCDSRGLFEGLAISRDPSFEEHLNAYNVVRLDMAAFKGHKDVVKVVEARLLADLERELPSATFRAESIGLALGDFVDATGRKFVFVIDEWDAPLRERGSKKTKEGWVDFLRLLFKNMAFTSKAIAACYMTGILPIVRLGTQSSHGDFREYTFLRPGPYAPYVGFSEAEVEGLAERHHMNMAELKRWYDGCEIPWVDEATGERGVERVYAPFSVMRACKHHAVASYWTDSEAFSSLLLYVDTDFDGLQLAIVQAVGGAAVPVRVGKFGNDMYEVKSADDVLTLLCHLGYLAYDPSTCTARVPNEEVRSELRDAVSESRHTEVARIVRESGDLLCATWDMDEESVAEAVARAHDSGCAPTFYNDEQALRAVVRAAYIAAEDHYASVQELPSGRGIADVVYLPKRGDPSPALVVELKWDKKPDAAIKQILGRDYPEVLRSWGGPILLVGITYSTKSKEHSCRIVEA